jgi:hypothetical protein
MRAANDNSNAPLGTDRRRDQRRRTLMTGKIVHVAGPISFDCAIHNLSVSGASVSFPTELGCPDENYLIVVRSGLAHTARVAWRAPSRLGLRFLDSHDLGGQPPAQFTSLRKLWLELRPR